MSQCTNGNNKYFTQFLVIASEAKQSHFFFCSWGLRRRSAPRNDIFGFGFAGSSANNKMLALINPQITQIFKAQDIIKGCVKYFTWIPA
jgi:hypothetical protein